MGRLYVELESCASTSKEFDMSSATHRAECSAGTLYLAIELSTREWGLTMSVSAAARRRRMAIAPGDRVALARAVARGRAEYGLAETAPVHSCYEAGREGFWPHRWLTAQGVTNVVVDSSSIEVPRRARVAKTDRLDGEHLLRLLLRVRGGERGVWHEVQVPTPAREDARHASRALTTLAADRTRLRNRVHSLLALHGVRLRIDARFATRVATVRDWADAPLPPGLQARVLQIWRVLQHVEAERTALQRAERLRARAGRAPACPRVQRLTQLRGVAARSASVLSDELFARGLRNRREVGALAGLVSAPHRSGQRVRDQGLARSGLPAVRRIAIELAWAWCRYQPQSALARWYAQRFQSGPPGTRKVGLVALARRLVIALWRYSEQGVLPAGAQLKA
jgi:transposase